MSKATWKHIVINLLETSDKEKNLKSSWRKKNTGYQGTKLKMTADFSSETIRARRQWGDFLQARKENEARLLD